MSDDSTVAGVLKCRIPNSDDAVNVWQKLTTPGEENFATTEPEEHTLSGTLDLKNKSPVS